MNNHDMAITVARDAKLYEAATGDHVTVACYGGKVSISAAGGICLRDATWTQAKWYMAGALAGACRSMSFDARCELWARRGDAA